MLKRRRALVAIGVVVLIAAGVSGAAIAPIKQYAVGISGGYETKRLLSVGDTVPETSDPAKQYRMVGIPDGLGAHPNPDGTKTLYMNHELRSTPVRADGRRPDEPRRARVEDGSSTPRGTSSPASARTTGSSRRTRSSARPQRSETRRGRSRASARARSPARRTASTAGSTSRTRRRARRRTRSTARAA